MLPRLTEKAVKRLTEETTLLEDKQKYIIAKDTTSSHSSAYLSFKNEGWKSGSDSSDTMSASGSSNYSNTSPPISRTFNAHGSTSVPPREKYSPASLKPQIIHFQLPSASNHLTTLRFTNKTRIHVTKKKKTDCGSPRTRANIRLKGLKEGNHPHV